MKKLLLLLALVAVQCGCNSEQEAANRDREAKQAQRELERVERERQTAVMIESVQVSLSDLGRSAKAEDVAKACEPVLEENLFNKNSEVAASCGKAYLVLARRALKRDDLGAADLSLQHLRLTHYEDADLPEIEADLRARRAREEFIAKSDERSLYAGELRNHFLDQSLDIKVSVSGKHDERLKLTYVLFNDVWLHNFKKGSLIDEIRGKGFRRVDLTDGYNWGYYLTFGD
jgi:hypothetical protein